MTPAVWVVPKDVMRSSFNVTEPTVMAGLPVSIKLTASQRKKLFTAMQLDKKVSQGEVKFVLAKKIGKVVWGRPVSPALIDSVL